MPEAGSKPASHPHLTTVLSDGAWRGRRAFVVGGGPSLRGFDFRRLDGELWIGCNMAFLERPTIALSICFRFMRDVVKPGVPPPRGPHAAAWAACPSLKVFMAPPTDGERVDDVPAYQVGNCDRTVGVNAWGRSLATGLRNGPMSGIVAANLADILAPDVIYLLGMDCQAADEGRTANYHDHYWWNADRKPRPKEGRYRGARDVWEKHAAAGDIRTRIVNLGPDSALECFERGSLDEVLGPARQADPPAAAVQGCPAVSSPTAPLSREAARVNDEHRGGKYTT